LVRRRPRRPQQAGPGQQLPQARPGLLVVEWRLVRPSSQAAPV